MDFRKALIAGVLAFGLGASGTAYAALDMGQLARLVNRGQSEQAYQLAARNRDRHEGDPAFDYLYGIAAIDSGHYGEGIFALERVLIVQPGNNAARLELARGYFMVGDDLRAKTLFKQVSRLNPPSRVQSNIQRYLDAISAREGRYTTTTSAYAGFGFGYDTNVNGSPGDANFFSPLLGYGTLNDASTQQHDYFLYLEAGARVDHPVRPGFSLFGQIDGNNRSNRGWRQFDSGVVTAQGGARFQRAKDTWRLSAVGQRYYVNRTLYRTMKGAIGDWTHQFTRQTSVNGSLNWARLQYPDQPLRDSYQTTVGFGITHQYRSRFSPLLFASAFRGLENSDNQNEFGGKAVAQRVFGGVRLGGQLTLRPDLGLQASVTRQYSDYDGIQLLFLKPRSDVNYLVDTGLVWLPRKHWSVRTDVSYSKNLSNITIYRYDRWLSQVGVRYDF